MFLPLRREFGLRHAVPEADSLGTEGRTRLAPCGGYVQPRGPPSSIPSILREIVAGGDFGWVQAGCSFDRRQKAPMGAPPMHPPQLEPLGPGDPSAPDCLGGLLNPDRLGPAPLVA